MGPFEHEAVFRHGERPFPGAGATLLGHNLRNLSGCAGSNPTSGGRLEWKGGPINKKTHRDATVSVESPAAGLFYCQQARALLEAFSGVIREVIALHEDQIQAVLQGDEDSARFDDLIHMTNERKREAKYAYLNHLETHGCSRLSRTI